MFKLLVLIACVICTTQASGRYGTVGYGLPVSSGYGNNYGIRTLSYYGPQAPTNIHPGYLTYHRRQYIQQPYGYGVGGGYGGIGGGLGGFGGGYGGVRVDYGGIGGGFGGGLRGGYGAY